MKPFSRLKYITGVAAVACLFLGVSTLPVSAQSDQFGGFTPFGEVPGFESAGGVSDDNPIAVTATFEQGEGTDRGRLTLSIALADQWHIYSLNQKPGGPTKTTIQLTGPEGVVLTGPFVPDQSPKSEVSTVWEGVTVEEHSGEFKWTAPIQFSDPAAAKGLEITVAMSGLTCREGEGGGCIPYRETLTASFEGTYEVPKLASEFREKNSVVVWKGQLANSVVAPGGKTELQLTAIPDEGFHVYEATTTSKMNATNFVLTQLSGLKAFEPQTYNAVITQESSDGLPALSYHEGNVTWSIPILVPKDAQVGEYAIEGLVGYQACTETSCRQPLGVRFVGTLKVDPLGASEAKEVALAFEKVRFPTVLEAADETKWVSSVNAIENDDKGEPTVSNAPKDDSSFSESSLVVILGAALIGGLILNLMPCVLPVVGLKLMALVDSAGEDHGKVLAHNLWYSLGLLSVFWLLAAIAIFLRLRFGENLAWGQQFQFFEFRLVLTLLVFVMALSFLGTWEIPLPGFASGKASQQLQKKEGASGAFFKGVFTTVLATPCSGPFLGAVFGFTVAAPPAITFLIFTTVGLGMALPYIVIGLMPQLVFWLPKPGAWMETVKQLLAFLLLGTVAYLFSLFSDVQKLPVFITLIGAWFACWMIGQVPLWDKLQRRLVAWGGGLATASVIGILAFRLLIPGEEVMQWQPYSAAQLAKLNSEGKTVLIDFTASWCPNCIVNYKVAINTQETADKIKELNAVPMLADWSNYDEEIGVKVRELKSNSIPLLAIYPGSDPNNPIILRDLVSQSQVLEALDRAGPSVSPRSSGTTVASRN
jgi:suppressor for copper-sensitivity B